MGCGPRGQERVKNGICEPFLGRSPGGPDGQDRLLEDLRVVDLILPGVVVDKGVVPVVVFPYRVRFEGLACPPIRADHRAGKVLNEHLKHFRHIHVLIIKDNRTEKSLQF